MYSTTAIRSEGDRESHGRGSALVMRRLLGAIRFVLSLAFVPLLFLAVVLVGSFMVVEGCALRIAAAIRRAPVEPMWHRFSSPVEEPGHEPGRPHAPRPLTAS